MIGLFFFFFLLIKDYANSLTNTEINNFNSFGDHSFLFWRLLRLLEVSQSPQIEVPYPPTNGGQQRLGMLVAFVRPSVTFILCKTSTCKICQAFYPMNLLS